MSTAWSERRDIRRLAMQVMYQLDLRGAADAPMIGATLDQEQDGESVRRAGFELAQRAWLDHAEADRLVAELAPQWPTHRQPPVDRAILRLAYHEMISGRTPVKVAINEAVELAKQYSGENSPAFINGVLDKLAKRITPRAAAPAAPDAPDAWLGDALRQAKDKLNPP